MPIWKPPILRLSSKKFQKVSNVPVEHAQILWLMVSRRRGDESLTKMIAIQTWKPRNTRSTRKLLSPGYCGCKRDFRVFRGLTVSTLYCKWRCHRFNVLVTILSPIFMLISCRFRTVPCILHIHRKCKGFLDVCKKNSRMMGGQFPLYFLLVVMFNFIIGEFGLNREKHKIHERKRDPPRPKIFA